MRKKHYKLDNYDALAEKMISAWPDRKAQAYRVLTFTNECTESIKKELKEKGAECTRYFIAEEEFKRTRSAMSIYTTRLGTLISDVAEETQLSMRFDYYDTLKSIHEEAMVWYSLYNTAVEHHRYAKENYKTSRTKFQAVDMADLLSDE